MSKDKILQKPKYYYDVKVECMLPATVTYRVFAETPEEAAELYKKQSPIAVKHKLAGKKELKLTVYMAGTTLIKFFRKLF